MSKKFQPGDVVRLKSGGPKMTVRGYDPIDGEEVTCEWMSNNAIQERSFHQSTLELFVNPPIDPFFTRKHNF